MPRAIGVLLPSSNRVVERVTRAILCKQPGFDACFARVPYGGHPPGGYDMAAFYQAATLLAEARPDVIVWNATRGALLGFDPDRRLSEAIEAATGTPCLTTSLLTLDLLRSRGLRRIGLVAQGNEATARRLEANFGQEGISIAAWRSIEVKDNFAAAAIPLPTFERNARALAASSDVDAILIWSTNFGAHALTEPPIDALDRPVLDSAAIGIRETLSYLLKASSRPEKA